MKSFAQRFVEVSRETVEDYAARRPAKEQAFFRDESPEGLYRSILRHKAVWTFVRWFFAVIIRRWLLLFGAMLEVSTSLTVLAFRITSLVFVVYAWLWFNGATG